VRVLARLTLAALASAALAACGSSNSSSTTTGLAPSAATPNAAKLTAARVAAASCMRAQGISIPDPGATRASLLSTLRVLASYPQAKVQSAEKACAAQIHAAFPEASSLTPAQRELRLKQAGIFATCMRSHGINFPDPSTAASNPASFYQALQSLDLNSPAFKAAGTTCRALMLKEIGG
jgi:hypothetical protein